MKESGIKTYKIRDHDDKFPYTVAVDYDTKIIQVFDNYTKKPEPVLVDIFSEIYIGQRVILPKSERSKNDRAEKAELVIKEKKSKIKIKYDNIDPTDKISEHNISRILTYRFLLDVFKKYRQNSLLNDIDLHRGEAIVYERKVGDDQNTTYVHIGREIRKIESYFIYKCLDLIIEIDENNYVISYLTDANLVYNLNNGMFYKNFHRYPIKKNSKAERSSVILGEVIYSNFY
jgi:hypothetical protein